MQNTVTQIQVPDRMLRMARFMMYRLGILNKGPAMAVTSNEVVVEVMLSQILSLVVAQSLCQRAAVSEAIRMATKIWRQRALASSS